MPEHHVVLIEQRWRLAFRLSHKTGSRAGEFAVGKLRETPTRAVRYAPAAKRETRGYREERRILWLQSGQRADNALSDRSLLGFAIAQAGVMIATSFRLTTISEGTRRLLRRNTTTIGGSNGAIAGD